MLLQKRLDHRSFSLQLLDRALHTTHHPSFEAPHRPTVALALRRFLDLNVDAAIHAVQNEHQIGVRRRLERHLHLDLNRSALPHVGKRNSERDGVRGFARIGQFGDIQVAAALRVLSLLHSHIAREEQNVPQLAEVHPAAAEVHDVHGAGHAQRQALAGIDELPLVEQLHVHAGAIGASGTDQLDAFGSGGGSHDGLGVRESEESDLGRGGDHAEAGGEERRERER